MAHILAVDNEPAMLALVRRVLEKDRHLVTLLSDAEKAADMDFSRYDLILLDIMMPGLDGFALCQKIRARADCPIVYLTARTREADVVRGLGLGADDYITKPFGTEALRARVNAHLRRDRRERKNAFSASGVVFYLNAKQAEWQGQRLPLTKSEYEICEFLALHHGQTFTREQIYEAVFGVWGESDSAVISVHIKNIRGKLAACPVAPIETVWGVGYKWV